MILDIIALVLVGIGFYAGYRRGLIMTVFDTLSILIALLVSLKLSPTVISLVGALIPGKVIAIIIGFVLTFLTAMYLVRMIGRQMESIFKSLNINFLNQIGGGALMAIFYALILSFVLWFLNESKMVSPEYQEKSKSYQYLEPMPRQSQTILNKFKPVFSGFWEKMVEMTDNAKKKVEELEDQQNNSNQNKEDK